MTDVTNDVTDDDDTAELVTEVERIMRQQNAVEHAITFLREACAPYAHDSPEYGIYTALLHSATGIQHLVDYMFALVAEEVHRRFQRLSPEAQRAAHQKGGGTQL